MSNGHRCHRAFREGPGWTCAWGQGADSKLTETGRFLKKSLVALQQKKRTSHPGDVFMYRHLSPTRTQTRDRKGGDVFPGIQNPHKENQYMFKKKKENKYKHFLISQTFLPLSHRASSL